MNFGRYQIVTELGRGSMGVIYQAYDPNIDRNIALKVLRQDRVASEDFVNRFLKEAKAIGRLSHANIVTVYDVGKDKETIFITMELLEGASLDEFISGGNLSHDDVVDLGSQIALALDYAHDTGIVHRDIKPTNIILNPQGMAKITDFGIAHFEDPSITQQTQAGEILGSPAYMSPEQVMGKPVDGRSDLYSLGVILYEMVTGKRPFSGGNLSAVLMAVSQDTPEAPLTVNAAVPKVLSELIMKSLSKNPDDRFQTGKEMAEALQACLKPPEPDTQTIRIQGDERLKKKSVLAILLVAAVVLGAGIFYVATNRSDQASVEPAVTSDPRVESLDSTETRAHSLLNITSDPSGAQVFIDGQFKGKTPLNLDFSLGKYEIRVNLPDHYEWEAQIELKEEGETPLFVRLIPMDET